MKNLSIVATLMILMSCSTSKYALDASSIDEFDLEDYKTFSFSDVQVNLNENISFDEAKALLKKEFSDQLTARGLRESNGQSDLLIELNLQLYSKETSYKADITLDPSFSGGGRTYRKDDFDMESATKHEATLTAELIENNTNLTAWEGIISKEFSKKEKKNAADLEETVGKLIEAINKK